MNIRVFCASRPPGTVAERCSASRSCRDMVGPRKQVDGSCARRRHQSFRMNRRHNSRNSDGKPTKPSPSLDSGRRIHDRRGRKCNGPIEQAAELVRKRSRGGANRTWNDRAPRPSRQPGAPRWPRPAGRSARPWCRCGKPSLRGDAPGPGSGWRDIQDTTSALLLAPQEDAVVPNRYPKSRLWEIARVNAAATSRLAGLAMNTAYLLLAQYEKAVLTLKEAAVLFGWSLKTAQNRLAAGTFPVPTIKTGSSVHVRMLDIADYFDRRAEADPRARKVSLEQAQARIDQRENRPSRLARSPLPGTRGCRSQNTDAS